LTFTFQVRVYYEDTDAAGVVYYASYLRFMERARTEWLDWLGMPLAELERDHGITFAVHRAAIDFRQPAILNDRLDVTVEPLDRRACSLNVAQRVLRAATPLASAQVALACLDRARWRPVRIPRALLERLDVQQTSGANSA
jgi:acyl-CoA thioester hydrolase